MHFVILHIPHAMQVRKRTLTSKKLKTLYALVKPLIVNPQQKREATMIATKFLILALLLPLLSVLFSSPTVEYVTSAVSFQWFKRTGMDAATDAVVKRTAKSLLSELGKYLSRLDSVFGTLKY